jgi:hypothetical protein
MADHVLPPVSHVGSVNEVSTGVARVAASSDSRSATTPSGSISDSDMGILGEYAAIAATAPKPQPTSVREEPSEAPPEQSQGQGGVLTLADLGRALEAQGSPQDDIAETFNPGSFLRESATDHPRKLGASLAAAAMISKPFNR